MQPGNVTVTLKHADVNPIANPTLETNLHSSGTIFEPISKGGLARTQGWCKWLRRVKE